MELSVNKKASVTNRGLVEAVTTHANRTSLVIQIYNFIPH